MIKTILVPATGGDADAGCFAAALSIARDFSSHIDALHVRIDPVDIAVRMSTEGAGGVLLEGIIADLTRDADDRESRAHSAFTAFCAREALRLGASPGDADPKPSAQWYVETGQAVRRVVAYGMTSDLVVASRGVPGDDATARSILEAALLEAGRPLLIPANSTTAPSPRERVAVAWKPTPQAARAVAYALPLLRRAREVTVVTVDEKEGRPDDVRRLVDYLARHGVRAAPRRLTPGPRGSAETLLQESAEADLLVMGGYGHSRLQEWVFGGFTQQVLADAPVAVLMAH
jgi:nucleotide-binding universal stress UspA family protein